jgi:hypothetical protein
MHATYPVSYMNIYLYVNSLLVALFVCQLNTESVD